MLKDPVFQGSCGNGSSYQCQDCLKSWSYDMFQGSIDSINFIEFIDSLTFLVSDFDDNDHTNSFDPTTSFWNSIDVFKDSLEIQLNI